VRLKRPDAATEVFRQLVAKDPANRRARYSLASVEMMAQRYQAALDAVQPLIAGANPDPKALALASGAYEALGDAVALYRLMRALKNTGDPQDAKQIPELLRKFNEARQTASKQEAQENRYRLVEESTGTAK
jgi:tetratricopeptide (TPR) repeat protein